MHEKKDISKVTPRVCKDKSDISKSFSGTIHLKNK